ncbi:hypothetical protein K1719_008849 [Acacia pycnantha]|nr:hypothetical protein K1719_008849 [Acacia pycnantha]
MNISQMALLPVNNILLDNNFCVKVADFGLSRLTNKSDVYSFGVVLMELISSMPAVDMGRNKDEITLANLALRKIQRNELEELVDPCLGIEKDSEVKKKVVALGELAFLCLQIDKEIRPSIDEVLEVLRKIGSGKDEEGEDLEEEDKGRVKTSISYDQAKLFKSASSPTADMTNEKWGNGEVDKGKLSSV